MSDQIIAYQLFIELDDERQELLGGGADFKLSKTIFSEKTAFSLNSRAFSPANHNDFSLSWDKDVNTSAEYYLGFGFNNPPGITI